MKMKRILFSLAILATTLAFGQKTVVDVAMSSKNHTTLVQAVKAAELVEALQGEGPFTVFAPTNEAFDKIPEEVLKDLLKPENKEKLQAVLTYHVVPGQLNAKRVKMTIEKAQNNANLKTLQGGELKAMIDDGKVYVMDAAGNKAEVIATDLFAKNGVVHVIDTVLLPE